jgi:hypothetical protein
MLKLPAGHCIFINPAYANRQEASIPMKLKVKVGEGELKRRAYGESKFHLVIKQLHQKNQYSMITNDGIKLRIKALDKIIPSEQERNKETRAKMDEISKKINELKAKATTPNT